MRITATHIQKIPERIIARDALTQISVWSAAGDRFQRQQFLLGCRHHENVDPVLQLHDAKIRREVPFGQLA